MILGVGTDIARVERIRKLRPESVTRLLTPREKTYCRRYSDPCVRIAGRFAAKEAVLKALGTGLRGGISWHQMEILPDALGAPRIEFSGAARRRLHEIGATHCHISISHQDDYAVAFAVLESARGAARRPS